MSVLKQKISGALRGLRSSPGEDELAAKLRQAARRIAAQHRQLAELRSGSGVGRTPGHAVWIFAPPRHGAPSLALPME